MKIGKLAAVAALSVASAGFSAPVFSAPVSVDIRIAPPAPRYEIVPVARPGYAWAPGYWDYRHNRYFWVAGHWVTERPGYYYNSPTWVQQTDPLLSLSIGALDFDPLDTTNQTLVAGIGRFSSFGRRGGARSGLLRTTNGGTTWTSINGGGTLTGKNISGVAVRGARIVVSVNTGDNPAVDQLGIFRSTDSGATFTQISSGGSEVSSGLIVRLSRPLANRASMLLPA